MNEGRHLSRVFICVLMMVAVTAAWAADQVTEDRLKALREAVTQIGNPARAELAAAQVCWSPDGRYSPVGQASEVAFGARCIVARYEYGSIRTPKSIKAIWVKDKNVKPVSVNTVQMQTDASFVTDVVIKRNAPLAPGVYHVRFVDSGKDLAYGRIKILPPSKLGKRKAGDLYVQGMRHLQTALGEIDAGKPHHALASAGKALPLLATVMFAVPNNTDAVASHELAQAVVAVGKMDAMAQQYTAFKVVDWAKRSLAHARAAQAVANNAGLKSAAKNMADALAKSLPDIEKAAAQGN